MTNEEHITKLESRLKIYERAINSIDDHFEYMHESDSDKRFVMVVIDSLTDKLKSLHHVK